MAAECRHNWVKTQETSTSVTHKCSKCQEIYSRPKQNKLLAFTVNATAVLFVGLLFAIGAVALIAAAKVQGP